MKDADQLVALGRTGPRVFPLALGCMGMSGMYGPADEAESIRTIHAALERGVDLLDTGDFYGMGHNEMLIGRALAGRRDRRACRSSSGRCALRRRLLGVDARPAAVKNFVAYSLTRLGVDAIDIYRPARLDPSGAHRGHGRRDRGADRRPATCATSACPRWAPRPSGAPTPCTHRPTCRSSTRW
jgi:aryl-alcohol dehydrogenase-like predicted oxidoreductase